MGHGPNVCQTVTEIKARTYDLRSRHSPEQINAIVHRAELLDEPERLCLLAVFKNGQTVRQVAGLATLNYRTVCKHVSKLAARVLSEKFVFVMRCREQWGRDLSRVGEATVLRAHSLRRSSEELGMSVTQVRACREAIEKLFRVHQLLSASNRRAA